MVTKGRIGAYAGMIFLLVLPLIFPRFYVYIASLILLYGLLATSLNFVLGFGGIYQFHHCVFYGVGAYGAALMLTKTGFSPWVGFIVGPLVAAVVSLILGLICIRLSKLYFGMLQISLGSLVWAVIYRWYSLTGGDDGIHGISVPDILSSANGAYYFALIVTGLSFFVIFKILCQLGIRIYRCFTFFCNFFKPTDYVILFKKSIQEYIVVF